MTFCILVTNLIVYTLSVIHKYPKGFNDVATSINILRDLEQFVYKCSSCDLNSDTRNEYFMSRALYSN